MNQYTKEQKKEYFQSLRDRWTEAKKQYSENEITAVEAIIETHGLKISRFGFLFVKVQMEKQGLDGLPYLDAKTFQGWKENGFVVKKGEKSTLDGITWIGVGEEEDSGKFEYMLPKQYHLFHRTQVEEIIN